MFSLWQCEYCNLKNYPQDKQCKACFKDKTRLSQIEQIVYEQRLLFDGFMRNEVLKHITIHTLIPQDLINLCIKFYEIDIKSIVGNESGTRAIIHLLGLSRQFRDNQEYFIAYKMAKMVVSQQDTRGIYINSTSILIHYRLIL